MKINSPEFIGYLILLSCGTLVPFTVFAQKLQQSSAKSRPEWLQYGLPESASRTFDYQRAEGDGATLDQARNACLIDLTTWLQQNLRIEKETQTEILFGNKGSDIREEMVSGFIFKVQGEPLQIAVSKKDEYWEIREDPRGWRYHCYILYAVAKSPEGAQMDELMFSCKYGGRGMWRSMLIPGWGQLYKGSKAKGGCILGGTALLVGGIIVGENLHSTYIRKAEETLNVDFRREYVNKADGWRNVRNICIGGVAALYVYNVIDAIVAPGMKRTTVRRFTVSPDFSPEMNGVILGYRF